jgi:hypothetical protein
MEIYKNRAGFSIFGKQHSFFSMDINQWYFLPSIEFRNFDTYRLTIGFLCFHFCWQVWKKNKNEEQADEKYE